MIADRRERFADQLLVDVRTINLSGIEEGDALLVGGADDIDTLSFVRSRSIVGADALQPKPISETSSAPSLRVFMVLSPFPSSEQPR